MSEKNSGLFVNLVKKAVGLPTQSSACCGTSTASSESSCCSATPAASVPKAESVGSCCGGSTQSSGSCCA